MKIGLLASCLLLTASLSHAKTVLPDGWLLVSGEPLPPASLYVVDSKLNTYGKKYLEWRVKAGRDLGDTVLNLQLKPSNSDYRLQGVTFFLQRGADIYPADSLATSNGQGYSLSLSNVLEGEEIYIFLGFDAAPLLEWQINTTLKPESGKPADYVRYVDI